MTTLEVSHAPCASCLNVLTQLLPDSKKVKSDAATKLSPGLESSTKFAEQAKKNGWAGPTATHATLG